MGETMDNDKTLRIGVIGVGGRGLGLAGYCATLPGAQLVAVCDLQSERLEKAQQRLGDIRLYEDHRTMLDSAELDIVVVATLGLHHRAPTVDAAAAGVKGIYVEKPMATSLADCDAMIEACRNSGTKLSVGHQRRWWGQYQAARQALRDGQIGRVTHGFMHWSTGRIGSMGTHLFDALAMVVDSEVAWVSARLDPSSRPWPQWPDIVDPGAMGVLVFRNGVRVAVDVMDDVRQPIDMMFYGTRGSLQLLRDGFEIRYLARDAEAVGPYEGFGALSERDFPAPPPPADLNAYGTVDGLTELIDCIRHDREPASTGAHGRHALEIIVAMHLSSRQNMQPVQLPLAGADLDYDAAFR